MKTFKKILAVALCLFAAATSAQAESYPVITIKELEKAIKEKKVILIDVSGAKSYDQNHIPTAINFAAEDFDLETVLKGKDKEALVVAYCRGLSCSAYKKAASKAKALGFTNVKYLPTGIFGWLKAGLKDHKGKVSTIGC